MAGEFQVKGKNPAAPFTLKVHRGEGMALLAMNWRGDELPDDFVGFAIEYREPDGNRFYVLNNRLNFLDARGNVVHSRRSTRLSPIQKFRWIHFPRNAELPGKFVYRVTPVFMNDFDDLSYGEHQEASIELRRETYPGKLNVSFTRGFVSSQAFVDRYATGKSGVSTLLPKKADEGLDFEPTHPKADNALEWMGFEARDAIIEVMNKAVEDKKAQVRVVAYDLNEAGMVSQLEKLGKRLKIIIDDSGSHKKDKSAETQAEKRLKASAGAANVKRQHMGQLQHNKTIVVDGPKTKLVVCGSTNFSWRGFYVQSNNAVVVHGKDAVEPFMKAFENYWDSIDAGDFKNTASAGWTDLKIKGVEARASFSPHSSKNALLADIGADIRDNTKTSLFYSLAFLYQTKGYIRKAIDEVTNKDDIFVYGISDKRVGGMDLQKPNGNVAPVYSSALSKNLPEPFKSEPKGGGGTCMHHKFVVIDFDKPTARVYLGSYNFSTTADTKNGENLLLIRDRRIAVAYMVEALRIFDHYHFRVAQNEADKEKKKLYLQKPPRQEGEDPWWREDYTDPVKVRDRKLFA